MEFIVRSAVDAPYDEKLVDTARAMADEIRMTPSGVMVRPGAVQLLRSDRKDNVYFALRDSAGASSDWVAALESPILVVPNDVALLAVLLPAYLLPLRLRPRSVAGVAGAMAAAITLLACVALQSRTALLTALVSMTALAMLWRSRALLIVTLTTPVAALIVDQVFLGGHLTAKFASFWDARLSLWVTAWQMFVEPRECPPIRW